MFTLVHITTGTFDSDWHRTYSDASMHANRCGLGAGWYICELTEAQTAAVYS